MKKHVLPILMLVLITCAQAQAQGIQVARFQLKTTPVSGIGDEICFALKGKA